MKYLVSSMTVLSPPMSCGGKCDAANDIIENVISIALLYYIYCACVSGLDPCVPVFPYSQCMIVYTRPE